MYLYADQLLFFAFWVFYLLTRMNPPKGGGQAGKYKSQIPNNKQITMTEIPNNKQVEKKVER